MTQIKESQAGDDGGGTMSVEYWEALKKKRGEGLTEGQAVLEYLKENEQKQKTETKKKTKANTDLWRNHFGRPV